MSKMSAEQKTANKAAQKVRDRAFTARLRIYRAAQREAEARAELSSERRAADAMDVELEVAHQERNSECAVIQTQIESLTAKLKAVQSGHHERIEVIHCARNDAWNALRARRDAERQKVDEDYPDISGIFYVSQWKIPADVQAKMDEAAAASKEAA